MTSLKLPRRAHNLHSIRENRKDHFYTTDDEEANSIVDHHYQYFYNCSTKTHTRTLSDNEPRIQSPLSTSNNRLRHLCSRLKRHLTFTKEHRTRSEDIDGSISERRMMWFNNYKSFSSSFDDPLNEFVWPDFEKVYDTIPACLINALPGIDDFSIEENYDDSIDVFSTEVDQTDECSTDQRNLFIQCKRGQYFRRNGICQKLDKSQYNGQLDTFIQQLMVEKLMRTWT
jgi:hypothetical protein